MNAEIKAKWVAALRSGRYRQGQGGLVTDFNQAGARYCCLGVLCEVIGATHFGGLAFLPDDVAQAAEIEPHGDPLTYNNTNTQRTLAGMNDDGYPFAVIADYIEARL